MARKMCNVCGKRAVGTGPGDDPQSAKGLDECTTCYTEGGWENTHSDDGHDNYGPDSPAGPAPDFMEDCWICHPELNPNNKDVPASKPRQGHHSPRRPQINHRHCEHAQTPIGRRKCRNAYWAKAAMETGNAFDIKAAAKPKKKG